MVSYTSSPRMYTSPFLVYEAHFPPASLLVEPAPASSQEESSPWRLRSHHASQFLADLPHRFTGHVQGV